MVTPVLKKEDFAGIAGLNAIIADITRAMPTGGVYLEPEVSKSNTKVQTESQRDAWKNDGATDAGSPVNANMFESMLAGLDLASFKIPAAAEPQTLSASMDVSKEGTLVNLEAFSLKGMDETAKVNPEKFSDQIKSRMQYSMPNAKMNQI